MFVYSACQQLAKLDEERKSMSRVIKEKENRLQGY